MRISEIILLVVMSAVLVVSLIISANLSSVADDFDLGTEGNATRTTLFSNLWTGLNLASLGIIIAAAVGIISLLVSAFRTTGGY